MAFSTDGWGFGYYDRFKVAKLQDWKKAGTHSTSTAIQREEDDTENDVASDFNDIDVCDYPSPSLGISSESEEDPVTYKSSDGKNLRELYKIEEGDRVGITQKVARVIDSDRYHVFASARYNRLRILWGNSEKRIWCKKKREKPSRR